MSKTTDLVTAALAQALATRRRASSEFTARGLVHHSDSEYVRAGVPGLPDPHSDGHARMLVPGCSRAS
jgi:hypothetical protein